MILDYYHDDVNHMMDWGSNGWIYMILGGILFLLIVVILIYFLSRSTRQYDFTNTLNHEASDNSKITSVKENEEELNEIAYFCPTCGEKLDGRTSKYCPFCRSKT